MHQLQQSAPVPVAFAGGAVEASATLGQCGLGHGNGSNPGNGWQVGDGNESGAGVVRSL